MINYNSMIAQRLQELSRKIGESCKRSGRQESEVKVVLVTKGVSVDVIRQAYDAGCRDFGENRVQEFLEKKDTLPDDIRWHLIGHLQTNKIKYVAGQIVLLHSLDRLELAEALEKQAEKRGLSFDVLIQVNVAREETKQGFEVEAVKDSVRQIQASCPHVKIQGLMTIGPNAEDKGKIRECFRKLCELRDELKKDFPEIDWKYLSMGMSSDFEIAVEEGANILRIGTAVFGARQK